MKHRRIESASGYVMGIFILFLVGFLLLVLFGASAYGSVVDSRTEGGNRQALLSYVSFSIRNHDHAGAVSIEKSPEGDMLVLTDTYGERSYSKRIYLSNGDLVEEYGRTGETLGSGEIQTIGSCDSFSLERVSGQCLGVRLNGAWILLHLRSGSEGAA